MDGTRARREKLRDNPAQLLRTRLSPTAPRKPAGCAYWAPAALARRRSTVASGVRSLPRR